MRERRAVGAILAAALLLRLAAILAASGHPLVATPVMDGREYHAWASRIAAGDLLGQGAFYQAPLYPYLLGLLYAAAGPSRPAAFLLNTVLEIGALTLLYVASRRLVGRPAATLAIAMGAAYGVFLFDIVQIGKSSLDLLLVTAILLALARAEESGAAGEGPRRGQGRWLLAGALLGAGSLNRGNILLIVPLVASRALLRAGSGRIARAAAVLIGASAVIAPVTLRNVVVGHDLVLTSAHGGFNFYVGNHERADGTSKRLPFVRENPEFEPTDAQAVASQEAGRPLRLSEVSAWWTRKGIAWLAAHPFDAMRLYARKVALLLSAMEIPDTVDYRFIRREVPFLGFPWVSYGVVVPLAAGGLFIARRRRARLGPLPFLLIAVAVSLLPFYVFSRYRLPLVPLLLPLAACGLLALARAARARSRSALFGLLLVPAVAAAGTPPPWVDRSFAVSRVNLANVLAERGDTAGALAAYEQAIAERPQYVTARLGRATMLRHRGEKAAAEAELRTVLEIDSLEWYARYDLGRLLLDRGDAAGGAREFEAAWRAWPHEPELAFALGVARRREGRAAEAVAAFREALARAPAHAEARWNLALLLAESGRIEEARAEFAVLLRERPDDPRVSEALRALDSPAAPAADPNPRGARTP